jgi:hypothetical protein
MKAKRNNPMEVGEEEEEGEEGVEGEGEGEDRRANTWGKRKQNKMRNSLSVGNFYIFSISRLHPTIPESQKS